MNYGPLEFDAYLRRRQSRQDESAEVRAARAAVPRTQPESNRLSVISGPHEPGRRARDPRLGSVFVYECIVDRVPRRLPAQVRVLPAPRPIVLVLSSHRPVSWRLELAPGADLHAVMLAGGGESLVSGAPHVPLSNIGGFCAFKPGSLEYHHLEREVLRCTGRAIGHFRSGCAGEFMVPGGESGESPGGLY
jgi:hypothetical protein